MSRWWEVLEKHLPNYSSYAFRVSFAAAVATGATAAFFAAAFAALFFFAQRFCCASAIFLRLSGLTTRFAVLAILLREAALRTRFLGALGMVAMAGFRPGLAEVGVEPSRASSAAIAWSIWSRSARRAARICAVSMYRLAPSTGDGNSIMSLAQ